MDRRNFVRGIVLGAGSALAGMKLDDEMDKALVQLATPSDVEKLARGPVGILQDGLSNPIGVGPEVYMKTKAGGFESVGYVTRIDVTHGMEEMLSWDGQVHLIPGLRRATLEFSGGQ